MGRSCNVSDKMEHAGTAHGTTVGLSVPITPDRYRGYYGDPSRVGHVTYSIAIFATINLQEKPPSNEEATGIFLTCSVDQIYKFN